MESRGHQHQSDAFSPLHTKTTGMDSIISVTLSGGEELIENGWMDGKRTLEEWQEGGENKVMICSCRLFDSLTRVSVYQMDFTTFYYVVIVITP